MHTGWPKKDALDLNHHIIHMDATIPDKIKRISPKCSHEFLQPNRYSQKLYKIVSVQSVSIYLDWLHRHAELNLHV